MNLERLIDEWLIEDEFFQLNLAQYGEYPAIFNGAVPDDKQEGWKRKTQYPRICYTLNFQVNPERASVGTMDLAIYCENTDSRLWELENEAKKRLKDVLMSPESESPYCFTWSSTEPFEYSRGISGIDIHFDIREFPSQETTDPDPINAINKFIKEMYSDFLVLGWDKIGDYVNAEDTPLFYCKLNNQEKGLETNNVVWMNCKIAVHFLCPKTDIRLKVITAIAQKLSMEGEVIMLDNSPMTIQRLQQDNRADYLSEGQLYVTCKYGLLRYRNKPHRITEAIINY